MSQTWRELKQPNVSIAHFIKNKSQSFKLNRWTCCVSCFVSPRLVFPLCLSNLRPALTHLSEIFVSVVSTTPSNKLNQTNSLSARLLSGTAGGNEHSSAWINGGGIQGPVWTQEKWFCGTDCSSVVYSPIRALVLGVFLFAAVAQLCRGLER